MTFTVSGGADAVKFKDVEGKSIKQADIIKILSDLGTFGDYAKSGYNIIVVPNKKVKPSDSKLRYAAHPVSVVVFEYTGTVSSLKDGIAFDALFRDIFTEFNKTTTKKKTSNKKKKASTNKKKKASNKKKTSNKKKKASTNKKKKASDKKKTSNKKKKASTNKKKKASTKKYIKAFNVSGGSGRVRFRDRDGNVISQKEVIERMSLAGTYGVYRKSNFNTVIVPNKDVTPSDSKKSRTTRKVKVVAYSRKMDSSSFRA